MEDSDVELDPLEEEQNEIQFVQEQDRGNDSNTELIAPAATTSDHGEIANFENTSEIDQALNPKVVEKHGFGVVVPPVKRRWRYIAYQEPAVSRILDEYDDPDEVVFLVRFTDGREDDVSTNLS